MDADTEEIKLDDLKGLLDQKYYLEELDYRDNLDEHLDVVQKAIHDQCMDPVYEEVDSWFEFCDYDPVSYAFDELQSEIERAFDLDEEEAQALINENEEELRQAIYDRDASTPASDALRHTSDPVCFYDTGIWISSAEYDPDTFKEDMREIKKALGIKQRDHTWDNRLISLINEAYYGGELVIYFRMPVEDLIDTQGANRVTFKDPMVALIDTCNGSGSNKVLEGLEVSLPFDPNQVMVDKLIKYSYVYQVCGMIESFADCTGVHFSVAKRGKKLHDKEFLSNVTMQVAYDEKCNRVFKAGGCTAGDMDMRRHRNTFYVNDFPCGTHCPHCGTFWID